MPYPSVPNAAQEPSVAAVVAAEGCADVEAAHGEAVPVGRRGGLGWSGAPLRAGELLIP
jgi:hypothetical protein